MINWSFNLKPKYNVNPITDYLTFLLGMITKERTMTIQTEYLNKPFIWTPCWLSSTRGGMSLTTHENRSIDLVRFVEVLEFKIFNKLRIIRLLFIESNNFLKWSLRCNIVTLCSVKRKESFYWRKTVSKLVVSVLS